MKLVTVIDFIRKVDSSPPLLGELLPMYKVYLYTKWSNAGSELITRQRIFIFYMCKVFNFYLFLDEIAVFRPYLGNMNENVIDSIINFSKSWSRRGEQI